MRTSARPRSFLAATAAASEPWQRLRRRWRPRRLRGEAVAARTAVALVAPTLAALLLLLAPSPADAADGRRGVKEVRSFLELRHERVVLQQWDLSCGAAALATILAYQHGDAVPERVIAEAMLERTESELVQARLGFSLLDLKHFAESRGHEAAGYAEVTIDDLVELGPAIVPVRLRTYDHFVVFRGRLGDRVLLADPGYGNRVMHVATFEEVWQGNVAFVVERPDDAPPPDRLSARPEDFLVPSAATVRTLILN